ncbi:uncharacterized protein K452DRAFT_285389 [Aplosporella prunicola CBS 121167]|uniref:Uncharacterized protein n=1 Tax=Aplosporella prunicola CBS 121167 TaxID=1176127 RepID=A0A6A6BNL6_9PEZI|nr:uncharacterized protein K452DRAFT_285389 [Aplosporella prunicola CBS 121167]KAF2144151.1 hypothetical protein K452DRAFT_285389 [Aplosporella prunicola CBS 121167]
MSSLTATEALFSAFCACGFQVPPPFGIIVQPKKHIHTHTTSRTPHPANPHPPFPLPSCPGLKRLPIDKQSQKCRRAVSVRLPASPSGDLPTTRT